MYTRVYTVYVDAFEVCSVVYIFTYISHMYRCIVVYKSYYIYVYYYTAISYTPILLYRYARVNRTKYSSFRGASVYSTEGPEVYAGILRHNHTSPSSSSGSIGTSSANHIHTTQEVDFHSNDTHTDSNSSTVGVDRVTRRKK